MPTKSKVSRSVRTGGKSIPPNLSRHTRLLQEDPVNIQPRYARIAQALIEEIAAGKFPVGALIATEAAGEPLAVGHRRSASPHLSALRR